MSFVTLMNGKKLSLSTDQLVIPAKEVVQFKEILDTSKHLTQVLSEFEERVAEAERKGFDKGYEDGKQEGLMSSQKEVAQQLAAITIRSQQQQQAMKGSLVKLSMQVVRRIADNFGAPDVVATLAKKAVDDLVSNDFLILHVHPSVAETVRLRLSEGMLNEDDHRFEKNTKTVSLNNKVPYIDIRTDDGLSPFDCQINTEFGTTVAGLEYQLECLSELIRENIDSYQHFEGRTTSHLTPHSGNMTDVSVEKMDAVE